MFREETQGLPGNLSSHFSLLHIFQVCVTPPVLPLSTHPSPSKLCSCHFVLPHSRRAISSLLNVDFGIKMMTEDCPHSQPRKNTTTVANKCGSCMKALSTHGQDQSMQAEENTFHSDQVPAPTAKASQATPQQVVSNLTCCPS